MKKTVSLLLIVLIPLLIIILFQGFMPFYILSKSHIKSTMENNTIELDNRIVENRAVVLQTTMNDQWGSINKESDVLNYSLADFLLKNHTNVEDLLQSYELQQNFLSIAYTTLLESLNSSTTNGIFLILNNITDIEKPSKYNGFFIRDYEPNSKSITNSDLLLERGNKELARLSSIPLDSYWTNKFSFEGIHNRPADDFFYIPLQAALNSPNAEMINLGYWSEPFILEDSHTDNHKMITYSIPLRYNNKIYGVLGVEISIDHLLKYFSAQDLDNNFNAGYALATEINGKYVTIAGTGALYNAVCKQTNTFELENIKQNFYKAKNAKVGSQNIYALVSPLEIYSLNVPYENSHWKLCGFVTEDSIYKPGNFLYRSIITTIFVCAVLAAIAASVIIHGITKPVHTLVNSISHGLEGLKKFPKSYIQEVEELHEVVLNLTESEININKELNEEKERYKVAITSSNDVFFTYQFSTRMIEIVNSDIHDGKWNWEQDILNKLIHPEDAAGIKEEFDNAIDIINAEIRVFNFIRNDFEWFLVSGNCITEENDDKKIVGYLRNIHARKLFEQQEQALRIFDPVTSLYRLEPGLLKINTLRKANSSGVLALLDLDSFNYINSKQGFIFGDFLLKEFSDLLTNHFSDEPVTKPKIFIRAGSDEFLIWVSKGDINKFKQQLHSLARKFEGMIHSDNFELHFHSGITEVLEYNDIDDCISEVKFALYESQHTNKEVCVYSPNKTDTSTPIKSFARILSSGSTDKINIASAALNMFENGNAFTPILDLLNYRLRRLYNIKNLILTNFQEKFLSNSIDYHWKPLEHQGNNNNIFHYSEKEYKKLQKLTQHSIGKFSEELKSLPLFNTLSISDKTLVIHMYDNDMYSGSILIEGIEDAIFENEEELNNFRGIGTILQNRINLERHDQNARAKADFLARMSHEIRTPMNGIIGMTEIALKPEQTEDKRIDCLNKVLSSSNYLLNLLNDILDMSKIESGKMSLTIKPFNLTNLLNNLTPVLSAKIEEKHQNYKLDIKLQNNVFLGDELRINQVLINLLGNAIKYSKDKGTIQLVVKQEETVENIAKINFQIIDNGIGIKEEDRDRIFENFEQADNSEAHKNGTGLGLSICSRLIHMMGSEIRLDSVYGKGSNFYFTIDLPIADESSNIEEKSTEKTDFTGKRILVAEDNALNMEIIQTILQDFGIIVECAEDGKIAIDMFQQSEPGYYDMILMDVQMPNMNGLEATHAIRSTTHDDSQSIPIVAMSANAFDEDVKNSLASGMNYHLSKPVNIPMLVEVLSKYLKD